VLLVNLLAALNFANIFLNKKRLIKNVTRIKKRKKIKFSHTRYRALGPELIPVIPVSPQVT